ncbi:MAG: tetratricopeptide repeat protein, partial [Anaerolineales bacterium]
MTRLTAGASYFMMTSVKRPITLVIVLLGWIALTLACSLPARLPFQPTPTPTSSPTPTSTATPTPTPTPDPGSILVMAERARFAGDWDRALDLFNRAGSIGAEAGLQAAVLYGRARTYLAAERWTDALPVLEQLLAEYPGDENAGRGRYLLGVVLTELERPGEAADAFKAYREGGAALSDVALELEADARAQAGDPDRAASLYEHLIQEKPAGD